jgi:Spy/CpxP family protein refolding chaperone
VEFMHDRENFMRNTIAVLAAVAAFGFALASPPTAAQVGPGYGMMGPGGGPGYGMMGPGYGVPGAGGYGHGYGMPGMGMGPGMWGGTASLPANLSAEQRTKIADIQRDVRKRQWPLMQQMHELMWNDGTSEPGALDEQAQRRDYDRVAALQKQMFETMLESRKRIDAVLTPQQREEMQRARRPAG